MKERTIQAAGEVLTFEGDPEDSYFNGLGTWVDQNRTFLRAIERVAPNDTVLDIGANIGVTANLLARKAEKVYAFEANPRSSEYLARNVARNGSRNVSLVGYGVAEKAGTLVFNDSVFSAGSHIVEPAFAPFVERKVNVPVVALDEWASATTGLDRVRFIKLDVEGFEPNVLAGGRDLIARDRPWILMEFNSWCLQAFFGYSPRAFITAMVDAFQVSVLDEHGAFIIETDPIHLLHRNMIQHGCVSDFLLYLQPGKAVPTLEQMTGVASPAVAKPPKPVASAPSSQRQVLGRQPKRASPLELRQQN